MVTLQITVLIISLLAALAAGYALAKLHSWAVGMEKRLKALEAAQAKHLPFSTADEIEDATAALLKIQFETEFRHDLVENALAHLQRARSGNKNGKA